MPRDIWGAEWGRYLRGPSKTRFRKAKLPCIYLLCRVRADLPLFDSFQVEVKIGKTTRSPQVRLDVLKREGYHLHRYWPLPSDQLTSTELRLLSVLQDLLGKPTRGREFFLAESVAEVETVITSELGSRGKEPPAVREYR